MPRAKTAATGDIAYLPLVVSHYSGLCNSRRCQIEIPIGSTGLRGMMYSLPDVHNVMLDISKAAFTCIQDDASVIYLINKQDNYSSHQKIMHMVIIAAGTLYSAIGLVIFDGGSKVCVKPTNAFNRYADGMKEQIYVRYKTKQPTLERYSI